METGDGKLILRMAYYHIAGGNGATLSSRSQEYEWPRNPWTLAEQSDINKILEPLYEAIP